MSFIMVDDTAINMTAVTHMNVVKSEGKYAVQINFIGGIARVIPYKDKPTAESVLTQLVEFARRK